ncbi:MAG: haloacid dehalogenase type II [Rhodospirillaceae bacterium]|jgi:2-haloacid dehalogenase|nr:haloacid dehalogenase type II [Rhodospirillaceae bacterium]MBT6116728.1 haloacid dehalogenase type II [Rhodospirillaceae bacterium]
MSPSPFSAIGACVFDAYGTLFDFNAATERCRDALGDKAAPLSATWRAKQLEYTWLRSLMGRHADFWRVTGDALDVSLAVHGIGDAALRDRLLDCYRSLDAYPDAKDTLARLRAAGLATAILSNGSPAMLDSAVDSAGLGDVLDAVLSVEEVGIFKPHPSVYQLAVDRLGIPAERICFMSSNGWDARGAAAFGFRVVWVNRFGQPPDRLPDEPHAVVDTLDALPGLLDL